MRNSVFPVLAGLFLLMWSSAQPAAAQDSQGQSFTIKGYSQSVCTLSAPQNSQGSNMTLGGGSAVQVLVSVPSLIDPKTGQLQPGSISMIMAMVCNRAHSIRIASGGGGLRPQTAPDAPAVPGFANRVDYAAQANWGAVSAQLQTSGAGGGDTGRAKCRRLRWQPGSSGFHRRVGCRTSAALGRKLYRCANRNAVACVLAETGATPVNSDEFGNRILPSSGAVSMS